MKRALVAFAVLFVIAGGAAGFAVHELESYATTAVGNEAKSFVVTRGATLGVVLDGLRDAGLIARPRWVYWYARLKKAAPPRAGEYQIDPEQSPMDILAMIAAGQVKTEKLTVPEGWNRWQIRDLLVSERWLTREEFERLCEDQAFLAKHGIPGPSCEGYLFPETYSFARGVGAEKVLGAMLKTFRKTFDEVTQRGRGPLSLGERELVTLASIVEKETGAPEERPRIACVFYNRLTAKPQWRLETDPTVIYAATLADPNFDGNIKRSHLRDFAHPYNTYKNTGLPPGPIASPGRAALQAVVTPATCGDFFFVSMNNGKHIFCPTYECHLANVQKWQVNYFRRGNKSGAGQR